MNHEQTEELIACYVLGSIDPAESAGAERELLEHLPGCASCQTLFVDLREVASDVALSAPPVAVPPHVTERIMASIRKERAEVAPTHAARRARWMPRVAVAAAIAAVAALGGLNLQLAGDVRTQRAQSTNSTRALALLNDATAAHARLRSGDGLVAVALRPDGHGVLVGSKLPSVPAGRIFEVWLMRSGSPIPAGVFLPGPEVTTVSLTVPPGRYDAVAITLEKGPRGSSAPTTAQLFAGALTADI